MQLDYAFEAEFTAVQLDYAFKAEFTNFTAVEQLFH